MLKKTLKPSLVEWKRAALLGTPLGWAILETFLGGMETGGRGRRFEPAPTLKPSLVEWKLMDNESTTPVVQALKPSLVEWKLADQIWYRDGKVTLKPSLVEWKPGAAQVGDGPSYPLKPSLVEWKPAKDSSLPLTPFTLETFLGGMETDLQ